jgi:hypothetical protein
MFQVPTYGSPAKEERSFLDFFDEASFFTEMKREWIASILCTTSQW